MAAEEKNGWYRIDQCSDAGLQPSDVLYTRPTWPARNLQREVQSFEPRCRLPSLREVASSKSIRFQPPEARAAQDHTSPTRKSTHTHRYGKLRYGKTNEPERHRLRRVQAGSGTSSPRKP